MMKKNLIIVNHVGTSVLETVKSELMVLVDSIKRRQPESEVVLAFSSDRARRKVASNGINVMSIQRAIEWGIELGFAHISILPLHVVGGLDYRNLSAQVQVLGDRIDLKGPLLASSMSLSDVAQTIKKTLSSDDLDKTIILIGHGTEDSTNHLYNDLEDQLKKKGLKAKVRTLTTEFDDIVDTIDGQEVVLYPLFTVSGYHVKKDVFDGEDSISHRLSNLGYEVSAYKHGLLAFDEIREIYLNKLN